MLTRLLNVEDDANVGGVVNVGEELAIITAAPYLAAGIVPNARFDAFKRVILEPTPANPVVEVMVP